MKPLNINELKCVSGGVVFGPAMINGYSSFILMLKDNEDYYYYDYNYQKGTFFKFDGSVFNSEGPVNSKEIRTFINQSGYRCYFIEESFFG